MCHRGKNNQKGKAVANVRTTRARLFGKVFVTLQECEIESESTWDDSDQRGSTNNFVAKEAAHCEKEEETWDESWP